MNTRILLFLLIGGLLAVRTQETQSGGSHHQHHLDQNGDIFIDDVAQADAVEGSAAVSDIDEDASGLGPDDEDTFDGSGEGSGIGRNLGGTDVEVTVPPITPAPSKKPLEPVTEPATTTTTTATVTTTTVKFYTDPSTTTTTERPKTSFDRTPPPASDRDRGEVNVTPEERPTTSFFSQPGILAAIIGGAVVGLLCAILLVMFIVYRMRKKDEGSYVLDEPRRSPRNASYHPANKDSKEFFA
ncbi:hypothetical protein CHUAL_001060 [Chamberlinius hualienensis]